MELHYKRYGEPGTLPLVILHGLFGISDNWDTLAKQFAESGLDVIVPDQRNHGRSGHSSVMTYIAMADDLLELLDRLSLEKVYLLGHSMGGKTAMQFAFDQPERLDGLIVADISPAASTNSQHHELIRIMTETDPANYASRAEVEKALEKRIKSMRIRQFLLKNIYWKDKATLGWRINLDAISQNISEIFRAVDAPLPFDKPVLFIKGELSPYIKEEDLPLIKKLFPRVQIQTIARGTHWLHADNPDDFAAQVMAFIHSRLP